MSIRKAATAALALAILLPVGAQSAVERIRSTPMPRSWSAVAGADTASVIRMAEDLDAGAGIGAEAPYCDANPEIARTLSQDFGESIVDDSRVGGADTQLWGSPAMGTWTLVLAREDRVSCIVASGTGYADNVNPDIFYAEAGLAS